ncbi:hypothetical protein ETD86_21545 [Nonomuraea turkmeniaca]|uniref:Uncharacterized protein n=1 Tax=Nonomuraea turkmeniaca TaxID=103838 RepID=A0A5S4FGR0_9ACTN|nr:hypothetical protein [Nonomuraea turkmeniaca]TMR18537.1 hypothetical protein ETD86_21545 [Nonomuraea turkmeniaca]
MKPHRQAEWSFAKGLVVVGAIIAGIGMSGALGDGKTPPPDLSKLGTLFKDVGERPAERDEKPKKSGKKPTKKALEMCPDDPYHCWWQ